jgi:hypothetical protein
MGDDVGTWNISAYHRGMMGGSTANIDRIAREGALFTDYYAQQSCTAGRAAFNFVSYFKGEVAEGPRHEFFYFTDNADLTAVRYNDWKVTSRRSRATSSRARKNRPTVPW